MDNNYKAAPPSLSLLELLPLGWLRFSLDGAIFATNSKFVELLHYPDLTALLKMSAWDFFDGFLVKDYIERGLEIQGEIRSFSARLRCYTGELIWVELNIRIEGKTKLGIQILECTVRDITAQKRTSEALRRTKRLIKTLLDGVEEGIIIYDREFCYQTWNAYMETLSDLRSSQVLGKTIHDTFPAWDEPDVEKTLRRVLNGEVVTKEDVLFYIPHTGKNGRYSAAYMPQIEADREITGVIAFVRELTTQHQWESKYNHLHRTVQKKHLHSDAVGRMVLSAGVLQDLPSLLELVCNEAIASLGMNVANICLQENDELVLVASHGLAEDALLGLHIPLSDPSHFCTKVFHEKRILFWDISYDTSINLNEELASLFQIQSILAVPLLVKGEAIGVLTLIDSRQSHIFKDDDLEFFLKLGNQAAVSIDNVRLLESLKNANENIAHAYDATLAGWAKALELRDRETEGHTQRVTKLMLKMAKVFDMNEEETIQAHRGAVLHDIGKMGIPDYILLKPGALNEDEREVMRHHPTYAYEMLKTIDYLRPALDIPYCHHEKWDGTGYPHGLKGEEIPLGARIFAVIDVWDALISTRPYRKAWERRRTLAYIQMEAGKHFDPQVVDKFIENI